MILTSVDLPAPLSPIKPEHLARLQRQVDTSQRLDGAKMLGDMLQLENRHLPPRGRFADPCSNLPRRQAYCARHDG